MLDWLARFHALSHAALTGCGARGPEGWLGSNPWALPPYAFPTELHNERENADEYQRGEREELVRIAKARRLTDFTIG